MNILAWFNSNSGALQSVFALAGVVLSVLTIVVLLVTWGAIKRQAIAAQLQADAARALIRVAEEQQKQPSPQWNSRRHRLTYLQASLS